VPQKPPPKTPRAMDIKQIKDLIKLMTDNDLGELEVVEGATKIHLKRQSQAAPPVFNLGVPAGPPAAPAAGAGTAAPAPKAGAAEEFIEIRSPMVGTYYAAPSPDTEAYVQVGAAVHDDSVVCILEAMKVMNEIKAECSGVIREICVKNAQPVEFGQVLFRLTPA